MGDRTVALSWKRQLKTYAYSARPLPTDPGRFLIFGSGRTGSTLLGNLLASHPDVHFADEVLYDQMANPSAWIEGCRRRKAESVYGIHVKIYQLRDEHGITDVGAWLRSMEAKGWRVIYLWRENLLRHVLSNMLANARGGAFHAVGEAAVVPRVEIDVHELIHGMYLRRRNLEEEAAALCDVPHERVQYERHLLDAGEWQATADRLFDHVGLDRVPVSTAMRRTSCSDLEAMVSNLDEVRLALRGVGWEHHLDLAEPHTPEVPVIRLPDSGGRARPGLA